MALDIRRLTEVNSNGHFSSMLPFHVECLVAMKSKLHSDDSTDNNESIGIYAWKLLLVHGFINSFSMFAKL